MKNDPPHYITLSENDKRSGKAAFFDVDGTLTSGRTWRGFLEYFRERSAPGHPFGVYGLPSPVILPAAAGVDLREQIPGSMVCRHGMVRARLYN